MSDCPERGGLGKLYDMKRSGALRRLTGAVLTELRNDLISNPQARGFEVHLWTGKVMATHVLKKYGVQYVPRTM